MRNRFSWQLLLVAMVVALLCGCRSGRVSMRTFSVIDEGKPRVIMEVQYEEFLGPGFGRSVSAQPQY